MTAEIRTQPVLGLRFEDIDSVRAQPGAFEFYVDASRQIAGMIYACPCGCGRTGALRFRRPDDPAPERPSWVWNGDLERPVLQPSVHHVGHWHGWLGGASGDRPGWWISV